MSDADANQEVMKSLFKWMHCIRLWNSQEVVKQQRRKSYGERLNLSAFGNEHARL